MLAVFASFIVAAAAVRSSQIPFGQNTCQTIRVQSGDSCGALASRCDVSPQDFEQFNTDPHFCSSLQPEQLVCCTSGSLPDLRPKPNPNGSCATYTSKQFDSCNTIGTANSLTSSDIEQMNTQTWGWAGCQNLQIGQTICISPGSPPMPSPDENAVCGPTVPGTSAPADMSKLTQLNPCPLNVCCNNWGQCGTTSDFCQQALVIPGLPLVTNKCISNCGVSIVNNANPPSTFRRVGYFESWNTGRLCLTMDVSQIDSSQYDTVHFGFGQVNPDYTINIDAVKDQFTAFKDQTGFKKIISFGGWSFSTDLDTFPIFRTSVTDENRALFAQNVANFIQANNLDGVDFDWEYPGAQDTVLGHPGSPQDGPDYLAFLKTLRSKLDPSKTISIAAPASYWYLRGFPIAEMSKILDYIVFMTYDLHGQWDYGNQWAEEGCPSGSCLRSHVNRTETLNSLSMITKAGVPASKILVGIGTYGRSFQMSLPGCDGPMCTYTGPASGAKPGLCTQTAGYISNAEIQDIIQRDPTAKVRYDQASDSNILTYGGDQWVAYMDDNIIASRMKSYRAMNFGGTVEWAIDLNKFYPPSGSNNAVRLADTSPTCAKTGHGPPLSQKSTCQDLENYQGQQQLSTGVCSSMWDLAGTSDFFQNWISHSWVRLNPIQDSFFDNFGSGQSQMHDLGIDSPLPPAPDCTAVQHWDTQPGTGPAYMIELSMYNVAQSLKLIYDGVDKALEKWSLLQAWWQLTFNTDQIPASSLAVTEIIRTMMGLVGVLFSVMPEVKGVDFLLPKNISPLVSPFMSGVLDALGTAAVNPAEEALHKLADFEVFMSKLQDSMKKPIQAMFDDLRVNGSHSDITLQNLFEHGAWVDLHELPLLNSVDSADIVDTAIKQQVNIAALNYAWNDENVWLMSYPMSQSDFDNFKSPYGSNDGRLKHYYNGRGYFFQAMAAPPATMAFIQKVPGYDQVDTFGVSTAQLIESAIDSFSAGGFGYDPSNDVSSALTTYGASILSNSFTGIFNIPLCNLDSSYGYTPTLKDFFSAITKEGQTFPNLSLPPSWCYCIGLKDQNGRKFDDAAPELGVWATGATDTCPDNRNVVGGQLPPIRHPSGGGGGGDGSHSS